MASKDAKIKQLELDKEDLAFELNAAVETAGDLFIGLVMAADKIQEQQAMLEIDSMMLDVAGVVIGQQNDKIDSLERAERRRQRDEDMKAKSAAALEKALRQDQVVDWVLNVSKSMAEGLVFTTTPERWGRTQKSKSVIDEYGKVGETTTVTKGTALVTFDLPLFGEIAVEAKVRHFVERRAPDDNEALIRNEVTFKIKMNGTKRRVMIASGGKVRVNHGEWDFTDYYTAGRFAQVLIDGEPEWCSGCGEYHNYSGDEFVAEVTTTAMPEPYRRRSGGCGGW
jgi:hypothetical protein